MACRLLLRHRSNHLRPRARNRPARAHRRRRVDRQAQCVLRNGAESDDDRAAGAPALRAKSAVADRGFQEVSYSRGMKTASPKVVVRRSKKIPIQPATAAELRASIHLTKKE